MRSRGTSLMRNTLPVGPYRSPKVALGGWEFSYERGNPVDETSVAVVLGVVVVPGRGKVAALVCELIKDTLL
jgi:hypothetical protein